MKVILFQPRFARQVLEGTKRQTIRPLRKVPIRIGDELSLRCWNGKPYRSKQQFLRQAICYDVQPVRLTDETGRTIHVNGTIILGSQRELFARKDGFGSAIEMLTWFEKTHGLPFEGVVIYWK